MFPAVTGKSEFEKVLKGGRNTTLDILPTMDNYGNLYVFLSVTNAVYK